jgi:hypothetical protein
MMNDKTQSQYPLKFIGMVPMSAKCCYNQINDLKE